MALIIEAPNEVYSLKNKNNIKIFLAGGITNCRDWQFELIEKLKDIRGITLYNPRRKDFPMNDPKAAEEQITWEYEKLKEARIIVFWFSKGSLNPIVLYELGMWGNSKPTTTVIGSDPEYERRQDVMIQTQLAKPGSAHYDSLDEVANAVKGFLPSWLTKSE